MSLLTLCPPHGSEQDTNKTPLFARALSSEEEKRENNNHHNHQRRSSQPSQPSRSSQSSQSASIAPAGTSSPNVVTAADKEREEKQKKFDARVKLNQPSSLQAPEAEQEDPSAQLEELEEAPAEEATDTEEAVESQTVDTK